MSDTTTNVPWNVLLFSPGILREDVHAVLRLELTNEAGIPELTSDAEVLTAAHERVALARLSRGGNTVRVEVLLLSSGDTNESMTEPLMNIVAPSDAGDAHSPA